MFFSPQGIEGVKGLVGDIGDPGFVVQYICIFIGCLFYFNLNDYTYLTLKFYAFRLYLKQDTQQPNLFIFRFDLLKMSFNKSLNKSQNCEFIMNRINNMHFFYSSLKRKEIEMSVFLPFFYLESYSFFILILILSHYLCANSVIISEQKCLYIE